MDRAFYGYGSGYGYGGYGYSGESDMKKMAEETGGRLFKPRDGKELAEAFDAISSELRSQYSIGYSPSNDAKDGGYRRIEVKVNQSGMRVQARKGYYAPTEG